MNLELKYVPSSLKKKWDQLGSSCNENKQQFQSFCKNLTLCNQTALNTFIYDYTQRKVGSWLD